MYTILRSDVFAEWLDGLADEKAKARISVRIISAEKGNFGDCAPVDDGISEMRVHFGPGYRLYFTRRGKVIYLPEMRVHFGPGYRLYSPRGGKVISLPERRVHWGRGYGFYSPRGGRVISLRRGGGKKPSKKRKKKRAKAMLAVLKE